MAIAYVDTATNTVNIASSITVTLPTYSAGDLLFAAVAWNFGLNRTMSTEPSGYTQIDVEATPSANGHVRYYYKIAGSESDPAWSFSAVANAAACVISYSGVNATPLDVAGTWNTSSGTSSIQASSITTANANELVMHLAAMRDSRTMTPSGSPAFTERVDIQTGSGGNEISLFVAERIFASAGATGAITATASATSEFSTVLSAFIEAAAAGGNVVPLFKTADLGLNLFRRNNL